MREAVTEGRHSGALWATLYSLGLGGIGLVALIVSSRSMSWRPDAWWLLFFVLLSLAVKRSGFHVAPQISHSLVGVVDMSAILVYGPVVGGWVAALSGSLYWLLNALRHGRWQRQTLLELPLLNGGLKALMALASGAIYGWAGGEFPLVSLTLPLLVPLFLAISSWFALHHLGWVAWTWLQGGSEALRRSWYSMLFASLLVELLPLPAAALLALVFAWGWVPFLFSATGLVLASIVVQRFADARQKLEAYVDEHSSLAEMGRALAEAQLDVDQLCELIYEQTSHIVDTSNFHLGLFDGDHLTLKVWVAGGQRRPTQTFDLSAGAGEGISGWLRKTGQALLVRDFQQEMDSLPAKPRYISDNPPRSGVFVPLVAGHQIIGTMTMQSFSRAAYTQDHVRLLSLMGNQAAAAIARARLFEGERRRAKHLALVGQVSQQVAAITGLDYLFRQVVHLIQETFGYYHVGIFTVDSSKGLIVFEAGTDPAIPLKDYCCELGEGIIGWVAQHGQPLLVGDVSQEPRYIFAEVWPNTQAELAVPLRVESQIVGVLDVQSDRVNAFGADDTFVLQALADQVALAVRNASLYSLERQRRQMAEIQRELAQVLGSTLDLDTLLNLVLALLAQAIDCEVALVLFRVNDTLTVRAAQGALATDDLIGLSFAPGESPRLDALRQAQHPLLLSDGADRPAGTDVLETYLDMEIRSGLAVPLLIQEESLGGFLLASETPGLYTSEDLQAAFIFASQAALAVENARLYAAQREEAWVSTALLQVAEAVSSLNTLDEILDTVVRITPILAGVDRCAILLWDDETKVFIPVQQYGLPPGEANLFWQLRPSLQAIVTPRSEAGGQSSAADIAQLLDTQNLLLLPLEIRGEMQGIMVIGYAEEPHRLNGRWTNILTGIANQTAIAVESDRLTREAAEQERLARELEVAQQIQASFLPESPPTLPGWEVAAHWRSARSVGGDFYDFLRLPNGQLGLVIADVADKGIPAALFMALSRTLLRTTALTGRDPARALERANELILSDARSDLFVTVFYAAIDTATGQMLFSSGGHNPPLLVRADGQVESLRCRGIALGVLEGIQLQEKETTLAPGDMLVMYTDGVTEAMDPDEEEFGVERLAEIAAENRHKSAAEILADVDAAVTNFAAGQPQFDDLTLVIARRLGQGE
jgi:serine phosphatase RsbU (regulator of sigma subunit)/putative methionine-R-sulfoxide reductase with GAF domain